MTLGWSIEETKELFATAEQCKNEGSLNQAFREIAVKLGRKPNSVRNYYYAQLKAFSLVPDLAAKLGIKPSESKKQFEVFSADEADKLVETILIEQAKGKSVRSIVTTLANGDKTLMLRYQNKYRAVIASRRGKLNKIMQQLNQKGATYKNPVTGEIVSCGTPKQPDNLKSLLEELEGSVNVDSLKALLSLAVKGKTRTAADTAAQAARIERLEQANKLLAEKLLQYKNKP